MGLRQPGARPARIETHKDDSGQRTDACLGSLAVKRVLGKDETPSSNLGLGFLCDTTLRERPISKSTIGENRLKNGRYRQLSDSGRLRRLTSCGSLDTECGRDVEAAVALFVLAQAHVGRGLPETLAGLNVREADIAH